jgi:hypothetical protein
MREKKEDVIAVQKTHAVSEENYELCPVIGAIYSSVHGIETYVKDSFSNSRILYPDHSYNVHILAVEVDEIVIVNVCKPPSSNSPHN